MSRPESVSSRMAIFGWSSVICRISWRFFSPPEKPSLRLRVGEDLVYLEPGHRVIDFA